MNFLTDWRDRRTFLNQGISFSPMQLNIANYSTDTEIGKKADMKPFEQEFLTKIHTIPDPLKKNLADTVITCNNKDNNIQTPLEEKEFYFEANMVPSAQQIENSANGIRREFYPFTGITNFISNVIGSISGAMFNRRPRSPVSQYYDCFVCDSHITQEMALENWHTSNMADQNKITREQSGDINDNMNNCRAAVAKCEDKISAVKDILENKSVPKSSKPIKIQNRRPKRAFIQPGQIKDCFEEDPTAENYVSLANDEYIEYFAVPNNRNQNTCEVEAPKMKIELNSAPEETNIIKTLPDVPQKVQISNPTDKNNIETEIDSKKEVIASCEDKLAKLKAMLLEKRKKPTKSSNTDSNVEPVQEKPEIILPEQVEVMQQETILKLNKEIQEKPPKHTKVISTEKKHDKWFKNPHKLTDKRRKMKIRKNIQDEMVFAHEIDSEDLSSLGSSPATIPSIPESLPIGSIQSDKEYFDEVKGRFHSASTDSDDSFQIVFTDSPKFTRMRRPSDCDSEDSFIVFEDSPDSCFTSNDLFDDNSTSDVSDSESDISDSGCAADVCKLSHNLSKTVSDLTDDSLYDKPLEDTNIIQDLSENDEVDCSVRTIDEILVKELSPVREESPEVESECVKGGLLIDEEKKLRRKELPPKKVTFSEKPPKVHVMRVWTFAARQARAGHWERYTLDRERFKRRIADIDMAISWVLKPQHRNRVMFQRFMPWWNKLKRQEAIERKIREEEERIRREREAVIEEEILKEIEALNNYEEILVEHYKKTFEEIKQLRLKKIQEITDKAKAKLERRKEMKREREKRRLEAERRLEENSAKKSVPGEGNLTLWCR